MPSDTAGAVGSIASEYQARGKYRWNVVPLPGSLATAMLPKWVVTMPCTTERPSPVPSPIALVVKNGSKMRALVAASMPLPLSRTQRWA